MKITKRIHVASKKLAGNLCGRLCRALIYLLLIIIVFIPINLRAGDFLDTILHINFGGSYNLTYGDIIDYEHNYLITTFDIPGFAQIAKPKHYGTSYGVFIDLAPFPPIILGDESHAIKFGVRGVYRIYNLTQSLAIKTHSFSNSKINFKGDLFRYQSWMAGPVIHYSPFIKADDITGTYTAGGGFTFFALFGQLSNGKLNARASTINKIEKTALAIYSIDATEAANYLTGELTGLGLSHSKITGYKIDVGIGGEMSIYFVNLGINLYYSRTNFKIKEVIYTYMRRNTYLDEFCIEAYLGIPIEWSIFPKVF